MRRQVHSQYSISTLRRDRVTVVNAEKFFKLGERHSGFSGRADQAPSCTRCSQQPQMEPSSLAICTVSDTRIQQLTLNTDTYALTMSRRLEEENRGLMPRSAVQLEQPEVGLLDGK